MAWTSPPWEGHGPGVQQTGFRCSLSCSFTCSLGKLPRLFSPEFPFLCSLGNTSTYLPSEDNFETYMNPCMPGPWNRTCQTVHRVTAFITVILAAALITNVQMCNSFNLKSLAVIYVTLISLFGKCVLSLF